ncbi:MAG: DUF3987 domain-containing protein [bacterium]|nr:DUF3987 domain-containing protein [bacterium]
MQRRQNGQTEVKKKKKQLTIYDAMDNAKRQKLARIVNYTSKYRNDYERYMKCLALVPAGTVMNTLYDSIFKGLKEVEGPVVFTDTLSIFSHMLCRKNVRMELIPKMPIFPWTWELIIGLSGINKSLPIKTLMKWLSDEIHRYPDDITTAALKSAMLQDSKGLFYIDEAGELLKQFNNSSHSDFRNFFLSVTDTPELPIGRKGSKKIDDFEISTIKNPAITIVGNSTLADFTDKIDIVDFFSGVMQRFNYTVINRVMREDRSSDIDFDDDVVSEIISEIRSWYSQINEHRRYTLSTEASLAYKKWYNEHLSFQAIITAMEKGKEDLISFKQRQKLNLLRSAMLYESIINPTSDSISYQGMSYAIRLTGWRLSNLYTLLSNYIHFGELDGLIKKIMDFIQQRDSVTKTDIFRGVRGFSKSYQVEEVLDSLIESEEIVLEGKRYKLKK